MKKLIISLCVIFLSIYHAGAKEAVNWEVNELFTQLSELRKEIKVLKNEVQNLKNNAIKTQNMAGKKALEIDLSDRTPLGNADANYGIVEFTDYQCPYCLKHSKKTLPKIKQEYIDTGVLQYYIKDFPLGFHSQAKKAAIAARCSEQQGQFWEMHALIIANSQQLSEPMFSSFATQLSLDMTLFNICLNNPAISAAIDKDISVGELIGVQGTPAFFIGRVQDNKLVDIRALYGAQSFSSFSRVINSLMQK